MMPNLLDWIFPKKCLGCREFLFSSQEELCVTCQEKWPSLKPPYCSQCALPFETSPTINHLCGDCLRHEKQCMSVCASGVYEKILHEMIVRFKYHGEESLAKFFGSQMVMAFSQKQKDQIEIDLICPIPLHIKKLRERGYNQAQWLAKEVGKNLKVPVDPFILIKKQHTGSQTQLTGVDRYENLKGVFGVQDVSKIKDKTILLIDDVYTTGATVEWASHVLLKAGASQVMALVIARAR